jgi:transcriptional regulator with XRE-family HTH domain
LDPGESFGRVLRVTRKARGMTQEQLALSAGVERNFVSLIERGVNQPTIRVLFRLAAALGLPASELVARVEADISAS